jgi:hypothetical protein
MSLEFFLRHGGRRIAAYPSRPAPEPGEPSGAATNGTPAVDLTVEVARPDRWQAIAPLAEPGWSAAGWPERPVRFVDGKDVGDTVGWVRHPNGPPLPVRLSTVGGVAVRVADGACHREQARVERVVTMVTEPFADAEVAWWDMETMRNVVAGRSRNHMSTLEGAMIAGGGEEPTIVDGPLYRVSGGLHADALVAGVIKTHHQRYLHDQGMRVLYDLPCGWRTPLFAMSTTHLDVISWYLRLSGTPETMPSWGIVRVELPARWFMARARTEALAYVERLSRFLVAYRCRDSGYARASVSLHPIVRAEELLGALFPPLSLLMQRFCRLTGL